MKPFNPLLFLIIILFSQSCKTEDSLSNVSYWDSTKTDWELGSLNGEVMKVKKLDYDLVIEEGEEKFMKKGYTEYDYNKWGFMVNSYNETYNKLSTTVIKGFKVYRDSLKRDLKERYNSFKDDYEGFTSKPFESEISFLYYYDDKEQLRRIEIKDLLKGVNTVKLIKYDLGKITEYEYDEREELLGYETVKYNKRNQQIEVKRYSKEGVVDFESFKEYEKMILKRDSTIYHNDEGRNGYVFFMDEMMRIESFKTYSYEGKELVDFEIETREYDNQKLNSSYVSKKYKDKEKGLLISEKRIERELDEMGNVVLEKQIDMIKDKIISKSVIEVFYYK